LLSLQDDLFLAKNPERQAIQMQPERSIDCFGLLFDGSFSVAYRFRRSPLAALGFAQSL
jgi:hypothetical protein